MEERLLRNIPALSEEEQNILKKSRVAVIGCGGLGGYVIEHLVRLGIGHVTAADGDEFSATNLNRQLYALSETLGRNKALAAADRAKAIDPNISFRAVPAFLTEENAGTVLEDADIVIDALDSASARLILEKACAAKGLYLVHGAAEGWEAQTVLVPPGSGLLEKLYGNAAETPSSPSVLSFAPGCCAAMEAALAVRQLVRPGSVTAGELCCFSLETGRFTALELL